TRAAAARRLPGDRAPDHTLDRREPAGPRSRSRRGHRLETPRPRGQQRPHADTDQRRRQGDTVMTTENMAQRGEGHTSAESSVPRTDRPGTDNSLMDALIGSRKFFTPRAKVSEDKRELHLRGGRQ